MEQALRERPKLKRLESASGGIIGVLAVDRDAARRVQLLLSPTSPPFLDCRNLVASSERQFDLPRAERFQRNDSVPADQIGSAQIF